MARIFITRRIPEAGPELLRSAGHEVVVSQKEGVLSTDELVAVLSGGGFEALISTLNDQVIPEVLDAGSNLKVVSNYAVGFDNIDLQASRERSILVTNTPGVLTGAVAEHTIALLLSLAKRIPEADRYTRSGRYTGWEPMLFLGTEITGKRLGLVGAGRIGSKVARLAEAMGMNVVYYDVKRSDELEQETRVLFVETLEDLLSSADFVSLHVPLLPETRHLLNRERLALMKSSAFLINTARGAVVDEVALVEALRKGKIRGAALDVFEHEPELSPGLFELENVILTPHIASATEEARVEMSTMAAESVIDVFEGRTPAHVVY